MWAFDTQKVTDIAVTLSPTAEWSDELRCACLRMPLNSLVVDSAAIRGWSNAPGAVVEEMVSQLGVVVSKLGVAVETVETRERAMITACVDEDSLPEGASSRLINALGEQNIVSHRIAVESNCIQITVDAEHIGRVEALATQALS